MAPQARTNEVDPGKADPVALPHGGYAQFCGGARHLPPRPRPSIEYLSNRMPSFSGSFFLPRAGTSVAFRAFYSSLQASGLFLTQAMHTSDYVRL